MRGAVRFVDYREIDVETQACLARIKYRYEGALIFVALLDKRLSEVFKLEIYDESGSRKKLEKLINEGVSDEEAEFLRIIQSFGTPEKQAKYFERFARGELTLKGLKRGVKSSKERYMRYMATKYIKAVEKAFKLVCEIGRDWVYTTKVLYGEVGGSRLALFVERTPVVVLNYVMVISDSEVALYWGRWGQSKSGDYIAYAILKYIVEGDCEGERLLREELQKTDFKKLLEFLEKCEKEGKIVVHDHELYNYIKSIVAINVIATSSPDEG